MKFSHLADCHIGSWRDPKLNWISTEAFSRAVDISITRKVDFVIVSGDMFNTSLPPIDKLKVVAKKLKELKDNGISTYIIAGSHDFSPSGKTMLDVLENADLLVNVTKGEILGDKLKLKFTVDKKTGAKITGMLGRRNMLDKGYYESLDRESLEAEGGFKIFLFHTGLDEMKPKSLEKVECSPISIFPKGFDYYAGGHIHLVMKQNIKDFGAVAFPGPLFPNNFSELEDLNHGGFFIYDNTNNSNGKSGVECLEYVPLNVIDTRHISIDCSYKTPEKILQELNFEIDSLNDKDEVQHKIITLRLSGKISNGKISDIDLKSAIEKLYSLKAYFVMRNTNKLEAEGFEEIKIEHKSVEEIEQALVKEHLGQVRVEGLDIEKEKEFALQLMHVLSLEKNEGEKIADFERRVKEGAKRVLNF